MVTATHEGGKAFWCDVLCHANPCRFDQWKYLIFFILKNYKIWLAVDWSAVWLVCSSVHIIRDFSTASQAFLAGTTRSFRLDSFLSRKHGVHSDPQCKTFCFDDYMHFPLSELAKFQPMKIPKYKNYGIWLAAANIQRFFLMCCQQCMGVDSCFLEHVLAGLDVLVTFCCCCFVA